MTEELKKIYASNLLTDRVFDTVILSHSQFSRTYYLVADNEKRNLKDKNGVFQSFEPFAFKAIQPDKGGNQQDLQLVFDNVLGLGTEELDRAVMTPDESVVCTYCTYIESSDDPQIHPIVLELASISMSAHTIVSTAQRPDMFRNKVPKMNFDSWIYKGIS